MSARITGPSRSAVAELVGRLADKGRDDRTIAIHLGYTIAQIRGIREEFDIPAGEQRWLPAPEGTAAAIPAVSAATEAHRETTEAQEVRE